MEWIELIHIRASSGSDRDAALAAFGQISLSDWNENARRIQLFRNCAIDSDLKVLITWQGPVCPNAKSPLGLRLAAAFSEYGQINHSVWSLEAGIEATTQEQKR